CAGLLLVVLPLPAQDKKAEWMRVAPKGGNCEILFPAKPKEIAAPGGGVQFMLEREAGKATLVLQFSSVGVSLEKADQVKSFFDSLRDGLVKGNKGKLISEKDLLIEKKYPARDLQLE